MINLEVFCPLNNKETKLTNSSNASGHLSSPSGHLKIVCALFDQRTNKCSNGHLTSTAMMVNINFHYRPATAVFIWGFTLVIHRPRIFFWWFFFQKESLCCPLKGPGVLRVSNLQDVFTVLYSLNFSVQKTEASVIIVDRMTTRDLILDFTNDLDIISK